MIGNRAPAWRPSTFPRRGLFFLAPTVQCTSSVQYEPQTSVASPSLRKPDTHSYFLGINLYVDPPPEQSFFIPHLQLRISRILLNCSFTHNAVSDHLFSSSRSQINRTFMLRPSFPSSAMNLPIYCSSFSLVDQSRPPRFWSLILTRIIYENICILGARSFSCFSSCPDTFNHKTPGLSILIATKSLEQFNILVNCVTSALFQPCCPGKPPISSFSTFQNPCTFLLSSDFIFISFQTFALSKGVLHAVVNCLGFSRVHFVQHSCRFFKAVPLFMERGFVRRTVGERRICRSSGQGRPSQQMSIQPYFHSSTKTSVPAAGLRLTGALLRDHLFVAW